MSTDISELRTNTSRREWIVAHDFAFDLGGAERVTALLARSVTPGAQVVIFGGERQAFEDLGIDRIRVRHPRLFSTSSYRQVSLVLPMLTRLSAPLDANLLASSYAFAHHLRVSGSKLVYCHTPLRQVWSGAEMYLASLPGWLRPMARWAMEGLRWMDRRVACGADAFVANSHAVARRIERAYGFPPVAVVHPPFDRRFGYVPTERHDDYVWVGRIVEPYKKLEPLIEAFRGTDRRLHVYGDGRDAERLRAFAPPNVMFHGPTDTRGLVEVYRGARAVLFPSEDDFGIVPIEAMACGTPVIALGRGGAVETVIDGRTGVLFDEPEPASMRAALDRFEGIEDQFDERTIAAHAETFSEERFVEAMRKVVAAVA